MSNSISRSHVDEWMVLARAQIVLRIINALLATGIIIIISLMYGLPGLWMALMPSEKASGIIYGIILLVASLIPLAMFSKYNPQRNRTGVSLLITLMDSALLVFGGALAATLVLFYPMYTIVGAAFALYVLSAAATAAHVGLDIRQMVMLKS